MDELKKFETRYGEVVVSKGRTEKGEHEIRLDGRGGKIDGETISRIWPDNEDGIAASEAFVGSFGQEKANEVSIEMLTN